MRFVPGLATGPQSQLSMRVYSAWRILLPLHTFVRFEPLPGEEQQLRSELLAVLEPTRAEPGCVRIHLYEATRDPLVFYIHSEWVDEAAFDVHAKLPHVTRFLGLVGGLVTHRVQSVRTKEIA